MALPQLQRPLTEQVAKVVTPIGTYERVAFLVPRDYSFARVTKRTDVLEERGPVVNYHVPADGSQHFRFADGTEWVVTKMQGGCGCGGG